MTKKGHSDILVDKHRHFLGKGQLGNFFIDSETCSEIGESEIGVGEMHHWLGGGGGRLWCDVLLRSACPFVRHLHVSSSDLGVVAFRRI